MCDLAQKNKKFRMKIFYLSDYPIFQTREKLHEYKKGESFIRCPGHYFVYTL